jgi:hypothetical protein
MRSSMSTVSSFPVSATPVTDSMELSDNVTRLDAQPGLGR